MSDIIPAHHITRTMLSNGTTVHINDYVYLTPEHLGEPYYIGRVMEFCTSTKRKGLQARIAWFNRPKDVINRKSADPCLLVATMHSDINPVSSIRGKCTVTHKYYVQQIDQYRKQQDNFYYNQLYDRYIQRVYDVVPCETVQNLPMDTLEALKQRYQFIVVEQGKAADLTVARRNCCVCQEWCQSAVSVKCAGCQKSYHMSCLNPPLVRKPSKGFAWQCAFCTRQEVLADSSSSQSPMSIGRDTPPIRPSPDLDHPPSKSELKRQTRATRSQASLISTSSSSAKLTIQQSQPTQEIKLKAPKKAPKNQQIKMTHMWPFRYFGINTNIGDILDVDDRIYPRAKSRIGVRYQASVPEWDQCQSPTTSDSLSFKSKKKMDKKKSNKRSVEASPDAEPMDVDETAETPTIPTRGGDDTVTCIYRPGILDNEQIDDYMSQVKELKNIPLAPHSSDLMDRALLELENHDYHTDKAFETMTELSGADFVHEVEWTQKEMDAFEQSIREHGHDLNFAKSIVQTKSMADIVRYFYQWKKTERYETVYSDWTKIYRPLKKFKKFPRSQIVESKQDDQYLQVDSEEESDPTIVPRATYTKPYQCMNCLTDESKIWRRSPSDFDRKRKVFNKVLCDDCGIYWLKYAKTKPIAPEKKNANSTPTLSIMTTSTAAPEEDRKRKRSTDIIKTVSKKQKENVRQPTPVHFEPTPCKVCQHTGPSDQLYVCHGCGMSVHDDCYGIEKNLEQTGWLCDPCDNKIHPVASYIYECVLCFQPPQSQQPLKRTSGYYWAHVQCATFIPEIKYVQPSLLSPVEYIGCVNPARLEAECHLCHRQRGACVACTECKKPVHVQCAIDHHFKLAFEIQPNTHNSNKSTKYPIIPAGLFGPLSPSGLMIPQVWCPSHNLANRKLIELHTRTHNHTPESSIITYSKNYKGIAKGTTPAMRRFKATKRPSHGTRHKMPSSREAVLEALAMDDNEPAPVKIPSAIVRHHIMKKRVCASAGCYVQHTPIWWGSSEKKICQRCHQK
ncbi:BAH domain-containing protein [Mucor mucedo]|uniref:BAH domain-containing protein n=1 Tax=Mucor mucedo TaxID=29922 RepID=UPI00222103C0|nr:BAH domain-containing protein [Mucor mucedo]KAI7894371.1 BAH domain-containing protein [Mucor mucedo]